MGRLICSLCVASVSLACGEQKVDTLGAQLVALTPEVAPIYDDGELTLYESKVSFQFPLAGFGDAVRQQLREREAPPFPRYPWLTPEDVQVQLGWTLSNLDPEPHNVEILVDPWNEFGRYFPGMAVVDADAEELLPNLSGIDKLYEVPGLDDQRSSRIRGTFTFDDMQEMAVDFATVINIIENPPPADDQGENESIALVNHAFALENRSENDPYVRQYIPPVTPGLIGFDIGIRTREPARVALEFVVELVLNDDRYEIEDETTPRLNAPENYYTVGSGAP